MATDLCEKLKHSLFQVSCVEFNAKETKEEDLLTRCEELCKKHGLNAEELATEWEAFSLNRNYSQISLPNLDKLSDFLTRKSKRQSQSFGPPVTSTLHNHMTIRKIGFATPDIRKKKPRMSASLRKAEKIKITTSPICTSKSYSERENMGKVELQFNESLKVKQDALFNSGEDLLASGNTTIKVLGEDDASALKPYLYQSYSLEQRADALNQIIESAKERYSGLLKISAWDHIGEQSQEQVVVCGRICCESTQGRLNAKSLVLEGGHYDNGNRVKLDVSSMSSYSLFPGQIVAVEGMCPSGHTLIVSKIHSNVMAPKIKVSVESMKKHKKPLSCFVASGPFSTSTDLNFDPLEDLLGVVAKEKPDMLVLVGPFVDSAHPLIASGRATIQEGGSEDAPGEEIVLKFEEVYELLCHRVKTAISNGNTKVLMVPSQNDVFHHVAFPQPPMPWPLEKDENVLMLPNPCTFEVNDIVFGVSANDIIFSLSCEEVSLQDRTKKKKERLVRLAEHVVNQASYYPIFPPAVGAKVDVSQFKKYSIPQTPDIMITPSRLSRFVKPASGSLCINPGLLTRGTSGGVYAKICIHPVDEEARVDSITDRTKVDIIRI